MAAAEVGRYAERVFCLVFILRGVGRRVTQGRNTQVENVFVLWTNVGKGDGFYQTFSCKSLMARYSFALASQTLSLLLRRTPKAESAKTGQASSTYAQPPCSQAQPIPCPYTVNHDDSSLMCLAGRRRMFQLQPSERSWLNRCLRIEKGKCD